MANAIKCLGTIPNKNIIEDNKIIVNGIQHRLSFINSVVDDSDILFPTAPDGTKTYDSSTGTVTQHASAAIAFAAETATNKVITSRQDFVFIESWHEKISDKGVVYPLGNVQYGGTTYEGAALAVNGIAQGYSAFGEWDTTTTGNCAVWANLTDAQKATFIQDHKNNIYSDNGELIQVLYRIRVVDGLGDEWGNVSFTSNYMGYSANNRVAIQGNSTTSPIRVGSGGSNHFYGAVGEGTRNIGEFTAYSGIGTSQNSHNGLCFAIPLCLVQRRNQGVSHPTFNSHGCAALRRSGTSGSGYWYHTDARPISSKADCFNPDNIGYSGTGSGMGADNIGDMATGSFRWNGDGKFYDAIYASDVFDLRMSSKKLPLKEIREKYKRMAIAGEVRGFEGVPFTKTHTDDAGIIANGTRLIARVNKGSTGNSLFGSVSKTAFAHYIYAKGDNGVWYGGKAIPYELDSNYLVANDINAGVNHSLTPREIIVSSTQISNKHKQANPTWTDIIGSPENIAQTFPDGVQGQWIPVIPDGTTKEFPANRKWITDLSRINTLNGGTDWSGSFWHTSKDSTKNLLANFNFPSDRVALYHYETQAHFTQDDDNSKVLDLGGVTASTARDYINGVGLISSLIGKIGVAGDYAKEINLERVTFNPSSRILRSDGGTWRNTHQSVGVLGTGPAIKTLDYLSQENNVAKLCYVYKEMKFNGTWGDNNKFEIVDNQSTLTDDNGVQVKYGTASFDTQYFISEE